MGLIIEARHRDTGGVVRGVVQSVADAKAWARYRGATAFATIQPHRSGEVTPKFYIASNRDKLGFEKVDEEKYNAHLNPPPEITRQQRYDLIDEVLGAKTSATQAVQEVYEALWDNRQAVVSRYARSAATVLRTQATVMEQIAEATKGI